MDGENNSIPHVDPFRQLLQSVASDIKNEDLGAMKFLCESHIPKGRLERVSQPLELFSVLIEHNLISNDQRGFLLSLFVQIGRQDLNKRISEKEGSSGRSRSNTADNNGQVDRNADTKENEVDRNAITKEAGEVDRNAETKEQDQVDREKSTKESEEEQIVNRDRRTVEDILEEQAQQPTQIVFAYSTTSEDLLKGLPQETLRRNLTEPVLFGRGKGIEDRGVFLNDETASRRHLKLEAINGENAQTDFVIHVLGKPIQVNSKVVKSGHGIKLKSNDELKVGQLNFRVHVIPGNAADAYQLKFARLSELHTTVNGSFHGSVPLAGNLAFGIPANIPGREAVPMNYYNPAQVPGYYVPRPTLGSSQGPQVFQQQAQGLHQAGAIGPNGLYPFVPPGYVPTAAPPHPVHMFPMQGKSVLPQEGPNNFTGTSAPLCHPVPQQPEDQAKQTELTAREKRGVYQAQKKQPSEHAEDEQEAHQAVTRSIEDTHLPKCEE